MRDKKVILAGLLMLLVVTAVAASALRAKLVGRRVAQLEPGLGDANPAARLAAASAILRLDPTHRAAVITQVRALMDEGKRAEARELLIGLEEDPTMEWNNIALELHARSYFDEAAEVLLASGPSTIDSIRDSIENLLDRGSVLRKQITATSENEPNRAMIEAEELDQRASLLWHLAQVARIQLSRDHDSGMNEESDLQGAQLNDFISQIKQLDARAEERAGKAIKGHPAEGLGELVLFHARLRAGDIAGARLVAASIADQPRLSRAIAGEVADTLLNLDRFYAAVGTEADVALARRFVNHRGLIGADSIRLELSRAILAQRDGNLAAAEAILRETLQHNPSNPRATCMLAVTLVHMGRPRDGVALLQPFNEQNHLAEGKVAMAVALLAAGETAAGQDALRESLQSEPDDLPAQLMLIGAMIDSGQAIEAEPHILSAATISPGDPRIKAFRAVLMIEKLDRRGLVNLLEDRAGQSEMTWRHAALAISMVLDDVAGCERLAAELRASAGDDPLVLVAEAWRRSVARKRAEVAALTVRVVLQQVDADPMRWPRAPGTPSAADAHEANPSDALATTHYVPMPRQIAMDLVGVALSRWHDQPVLLDYSARLALWLDKPQVARQRLDRLVAVTTGGFSPTVRAMRAYLDSPTSSVAPDPSSSINDWLELSAALARHDQPAASKDLRAMLTDHFWAESAVLMVLRDAVARGDSLAAEEVLAEVQKINNPLALLSRARWELTIGKFSDALQHATGLANGEEPDSEMRVQAAEVAARADLALGRNEQASGVFEALAFSVAYRRLEMQSCAVDVTLRSGRTREAAAALASLLMEPQTPPRALDRLLAVGRTVMTPPRLQTFVDHLLLSEPDSPILLVYKAECLADAGRLDDGREVAQRVAKLQPDAPRVRALLATLAARATQPTTSAAAEGGVR